MTHSPRHSAPQGHIATFPHTDRTKAQMASGGPRMKSEQIIKNIETMLAGMRMDHELMMFRKVVAKIKEATSFAIANRRDRP